MADQVEVQGGEMPTVKVIDAVPSGGLAQVYANLLDLSWTSHDIQIHFNHNHRMTNTETPTNRVEHRAIVTLNWSQAKNLALMLNDVVARYEELNGPIEPVRIP